MPMIIPAAEKKSPGIISLRSGALKLPVESILAREKVT